MSNYKFEGMTKRYFLYTTTANATYATTLLQKYNLSYDSHAAAATNLQEISFLATREQRDSIANEVFSGSDPVYFSESKLAVSAAMGSMAVTVTTLDSPATLLAGSKTTTGAVAEAIAASTTCHQITLQAAITNTDYVKVGNATAQNIMLGPGQSVDLTINDLAKIYILRNGADNQTVTWVGS